MKFLKSRTKNALFLCSVQQFQKAIVLFQVSARKFFLLQSLVQKSKSLDLGPKKLDLGSFGLEFENNIVIFEISALELVYLQNFVVE